MTDGQINQEINAVLKKVYEAQAAAADNGDYDRRDELAETAKRLRLALPSTYKAVVL